MSTPRARDDFAVHVALWQRGRGLTDAAVSLPARGQVFDTSVQRSPAVRAEAPVRLAREPLTAPPRAGRPRRRGARASSVVPMGSTGVKTMAVVDGTVDAYVHAGGQYEWDSAAPVAVAQAPGSSRPASTAPPARTTARTRGCPDLVVCHPALRPTCARSAREHGRGDGRSHDPVRPEPAPSSSRPRASTSSARSPPRFERPACCSPAARTRS